MKIKMKTILAGPDPEKNAHPGQVIDRPRAEAYALIEAGHAEQHGDVDPDEAAGEQRDLLAGRETATLSPAERRKAEKAAKEAARLAATAAAGDAGGDQGDKGAGGGK